MTEDDKRRRTETDRAVAFLDTADYLRAAAYHLEKARLRSGLLPDEVQSHIAWLLGETRRLGQGITNQPVAPEPTRREFLARRKDA